MPDHRLEHDTFGEIAVPADRLWGAQTQRSLHHFAISDERMPRELLECVAEHVARTDQASQPVQAAMERRYFIDLDDLTPRVFYRMTDNWLELTVRFVAAAHGVRDIKDRIARSVLAKFDASRIEIASATYEIVGLPAVRVQGLEAK